MIPLTPRDRYYEHIGRVAAWHGLPLHIVLRKDMSRRAAAARHDCIVAFHARWPLVPTTIIGRIFNLHHTTVLYHLGRLKDQRVKPL